VAGYKVNLYHMKGKPMIIFAHISGGTFKKVSARQQVAPGLFANVRTNQPIVSPETLAHEQAAARSQTITADGLPELCYAAAITQPIGQRVALIKRGESGYYPSQYDNEHLSLEDVTQLVEHLNKQLRVSQIQARAMLNGSMFGWNVAAADPKHIGVCR